MPERFDWAKKAAGGGEVNYERLANNKIHGAKLKGLGDGPMTAAEIAKGILSSALPAIGAKPESRMIVRRVCRGTLSAMHSIGQDVPQTSACILRLLADGAQELNCDLTELKTWCMEGIADFSLIAGVEMRAHIRRRLDDSLPGSGETFDALCLKAKAGKWYTQ